MSTPEDPYATAESALLARAFQVHAALSPAQVEYLRQRGFLPEPPAPVYDYHDEERYYAQREADAADDELDEAGDRLAQRRAGRGRSERSTPEWSLGDLGDHLEHLLERQRDRLLILTHLAPEADSWDEVLAHLRQREAGELDAILTRSLEGGFLSLCDLWAILTLDDFRQPFAAAGAAYRGYLAVIQATDHAQLPGKYTWVLRQEAVQAVQQFLHVQRALLGAAGRVWRDHPTIVSRHLRKAPHRLGLLAHVLLFNSQVAGSPARAWTAREERFASLPPQDHADAYRRAWTLAVQMDPEAILPFLVEFFTPPAEGPMLLCPAGWNELGYRVREPGS
jgi:hypothetical protein